ncbi:MAG: NAD(P)-dependent oxidoreductase [Fastidiosipila sp.]|nr:NAD(P)-dependent oxidoreductase [Fastidiosipila sp.]
MKFVISGAGGFLGQNLLEIIAKKTIAKSVLALDIDLSVLKNYKNKQRFSLCTNEDFLTYDLDLSEYTLINLAYARSSNFEAVKSSCKWTFALFKKLEASGCKKYVNISSQSVYDPQREFPATESDLPQVSELYDLGKYYLENWIREFSEKHGALYLNLRLSSLVGPNFPQRITSRLVNKALKDHELSINLNGQIFSYMHVRDASLALAASAELDEKSDWNKVYNIGTDEKYTIEDIARCIEDIFAKENLPLKINRVLAKANKLNSSVDATLFRCVTGWAAEYSLYDIVEEEFYQELRKRDN